MTEQQSQKSVQSSNEMLRRLNCNKAASLSSGFSSTIGGPIISLLIDSDKMPSGKLQVLLVSAKGLHDTDFFTKMDPYATLSYRAQEQKSNVASGQGSSPEWNETFVFSVTSDEETELVIKIKDNDVGSEDDIVGEAKIPLEPLFLARSIPPTPYNVVINDEFCGEVRVGLEFIPEETHEHGHGQGYGHHHGHGHHEEEGNFGGWKESSY